MEQLAEHASLLAQLALNGEQRGNHELTLTGAIEVLVAHRTKRQNPRQDVANLDDEALRAIGRRGPNRQIHPRIK
jgi:hypothetical protein